MGTPSLPPTRRYRWGDEAYKVYKIIDYDPTKSDGKYYLVAWADADEHGKAYPDSWEPTKFVGKELRDAFFSDQQEKVRRLITVDARPLDSLVQRTCATAVMADRSEHFGIEHKIPLPALALRDVCVHFLKVLESDFDFEVRSTYLPNVKATVTEARLTMPEKARARTARPAACPPIARLPRC